MCWRNGMTKTRYELNSWFKKRKRKIFEKMEDLGLQTDFFYFEVGVMIIRNRLLLYRHSSYPRFATVEEFYYQISCVSFSLYPAEDCRQRAATTVKGKMQIMPSHEEDDVENFYYENLEAVQTKDITVDNGYRRRNYLFSETSDLSLYKLSQKRNSDVSQMCHLIKSL
jgi:hypothetical protein